MDLESSSVKVNLFQDEKVLSHSEIFGIQTHIDSNGKDITNMWKLREKEYKVKVFQVKDQLEIFIRRLKFELEWCNSLLRFPEYIISGNMSPDARTPAVTARAIELEVNDTGADLHPL